MVVTVLVIIIIICIRFWVFKIISSGFELILIILSCSYNIFSTFLILSNILSRMRCPVSPFQAWYHNEDLYRMVDWLLLRLLSRPAQWYKRFLCVFEYFSVIFFNRDEISFGRSFKVCCRVNLDSWYHVP